MPLSAIAEFEEVDGVRALFDKQINYKIRVDQWHTHRQKFYQETTAADGRAWSDERFLTLGTYRKEGLEKTVDPVWTGVKLSATQRWQPLSKPTLAEDTPVSI